MTGRWLGRTSCFPLISREWNAACGCTPLASLSRLNLFPYLDLPCSVLVHTRRLERCQPAHALIFGCVAVLVHSVDSGLMHGTVNKPPKSAILICKATWWLFVCLILIHTSMFILWTNTSLLFLPFPPSPSYLSACVSPFSFLTACYYPIPPLDLASIFLSLCLNWLFEIQCWADLVSILSFFFSYLLPLWCQIIICAYAMWFMTILRVYFPFRSDLRLSLNSGCFRASRAGRTIHRSLFYCVLCEYGTILSSSLPLV